MFKNKFRLMVLILFFSCNIRFLYSSNGLNTDNHFGLGILRKNIENPVVPKDTEEIKYFFSRYIYGIAIGGWDKYQENKINGICLAGASELLFCNGIHLGIVAGSYKL